MLSKFMLGHTLLIPVLSLKLTYGFANMPSLVFNEEIPHYTFSSLYFTQYIGALCKHNCKGCLKFQKEKSINFKTLFYFFT